VKVGVTGKPTLSNDEMTAAFRDSQKATYLAFALTLGLLLLAFLRVGKPIVMLIVLILSLCWSIGVATLVIGHLSLFSVMFISMVIGIGIDYGIYFLFRYEEGPSWTVTPRAIGIAAARRPRDAAQRRHGSRHAPCPSPDLGRAGALRHRFGTAILRAGAMMTQFPHAGLMDRRHADRPRGHAPRWRGVHPRAIRGAADLTPRRC
jgi:hypothetical protein